MHIHSFRDSYCAGVCCCSALDSAYLKMLALWGLINTTGCYFSQGKLTSLKLHVKSSGFPAVHQISIGRLHAIISSEILH